MIDEITKGTERGRAADPGSYAKAILNILDDFSEEKARIHDTQKAILNILADFSDEKVQLAGVQKAILNVLEDSAGEKEQLESTQQAILNILEDFDTEKKKVEQINRDLDATIKELEAFSYSVSHDLRSPLRAVDGFARILVEDHGQKLDDEGRRVIQVIRDGTRKMGRLIDDLLAFSRVGRMSLAANRIDMEVLALEVFTELTSSGTICEFRVKAMPPCVGDRALLRQVWVNLLSNGIKFTGKNGHPMIEAGGYADGAENRYFVMDNGTGFDMRYYDKLFGVFQRLHREEEFEGTGVGLAIVQRIVSRHGGRVWAEGKVDEGAAFYFSLPRGGQDGPI